MPSSMPILDLVQALDGAATQARERSQEPADAHDQLASAATSLRAALTGPNRSGGAPSTELERSAIDGGTAERLRAELTTLSHDRSDERAHAVADQLRSLRARLT